MKRTKQRRKIRYDRIIAALCMIGAILFLLFMLVVKGYDYLIHGLSSNTGETPVYYLLVGTDDQPLPEADSIIVAAVNHKTKSLTLISIPENTKIGEENKNQMLLKDTYKEGGIEETRSAVENLLHTRIHYFLECSPDTFTRVMEKIGDIQFYVEKTMIHDDSEGNSDIYLHQGYQTLSPHNTLAYVRYIDTADNEIGRWQRQERLMKAVISYIQNNSSIYNWFLAYRNWNSEGNNITSTEAASLLYDISNFNPENISFVILPGEIKEEKKQKYWQINPIAVQKVIGFTLQEEEETT